MITAINCSSFKAERQLAYTLLKLSIKTIARTILNEIKHKLKKIAKK